MTPQHDVVIPSINGGWLAIGADPPAMLGALRTSAMALWGRDPSADDFLGSVSLVTPGGSVSCPVLWDRERQLRFVHFFDLLDRMTWQFPQTADLAATAPELRIAAVVTNDGASGHRKRAGLDIALRSPIRDRELTARLVVPTSQCRSASRSCVGLFPAVTDRDVDG